MMKEEIIRAIETQKLIAIMRGIPSGSSVAVAQALYDGGIRIAEIPYDQKDPASWIQTAEAIAAVSDAFAGKMFVGAGTVTSTELAELTYRNQGQFIVSPNSDAAVIRRTRELGMVSIPGAMTPSEILTAHEAGADFVKVFPAGILGGPAYLKAVCTPINHIKLVAVVGISEENAAEYLRSGAVALGVGSSLMKKEWIADGDFGKITEAAERLCRTVGNFT